MLNNDIAKINDLVDRGIALAKEKKAKHALKLFNEIIRLTQDIHAPNIIDFRAKILFNKGVALSLLGKHTSVIAICNKILALVKNSEDTRHQILTAKVLLNQCAAYKAQGNIKSAVKNCDRIVKLFENEKIPVLIQCVTESLFNLAVFEYENGRYEPAVALFDRIINNNGNDNDIEAKKMVMEALINKGIALFQLKNAGEALHCHDQALAMCKAGDNPETKLLVAKALFNKSSVLYALEQKENAVAILDSAIELIENEDGYEFQMLLANVLINQGLILGELDQLSDAVSVFETVAIRFCESNSPKFQEIVLQAMINKAIALDKKGEIETAVSEYSYLIDRYSDLSNPFVRQIIDRATAYKTSALSAYSKIASRVEQKPEPAEKAEKIIELSEEYEVEQDRQASGQTRNTPTGSDPAGVYDFHGNDEDRNAVFEIIQHIKSNYMGQDGVEFTVDLAETLISQGVAFGEAAKPETAVLFFEELITLFRNIKDESIYPFVIKAYYNEGIAFSELGMPTEAIEVYDEAISLFNEATMTEILELKADIIINKGFLLDELDKPEEALATFDEFLNCFEAKADTIRIQDLIIEAYFKKYEILSHLMQLDKALVLLGEMESKLEKLTLINQSHTKASLLFHKGNIMEKLSKWDAAQKAFEEILHCFGQEKNDQELQGIVNSAYHKLENLRAKLINSPHKIDNLLKLCNQIDRLLISKACSSVQSAPDSTSLDQKMESGLADEKKTPEEPADKATMLTVGQLAYRPAPLNTEQVSYTVVDPLLKASEEQIAQSVFMKSLKSHHHKVGHFVENRNGDHL